jgi:hypothetical protein
MNAKEAEKLLESVRLEKEKALLSVKQALKDVERLQFEADKAEQEQRTAAENRSRQRQALFAGGGNSFFSMSSWTVMFHHFTNL